MMRDSRIWKSHCQRVRRPRRGVQVLEVLMTVPLVVLTLVSGIHYGIAGVTKQTMQCTASAAANEAALGGTAEEIQIAADRVLAAHELQIGEGVLLVIEYAEGKQLVLGDKTVFPAELEERRRELLDGEVRAMLFVARGATGIPAAINFLGTEINNRDLSAVATSTAG